ncbi:hypothetical protein Enr13x_34490 [Stieleria neptunia]|uniref:Uncharacterized protein n=1 Tax=Stieleria neptunia TaxID=2527979 RepID=A0A518HRW4_9BACT|nr:hypothetical protein Enr13x_34490 [Stieleria neptunia]
MQNDLTALRQALDVGMGKNVSRRTMAWKREGRGGDKERGRQGVME